MTVLKHLFTPISIGPMTSQNRLLMSAMSINFGVDDHGHVTDQLTQYLVARAKGGTGLLLVGGGAVHPSGIELPHLPRLWDDGCIPSLKKMTAGLKPFGTKIGMQLMHGGRQSYHDQKVAPSPIPAPAVVKGVPKELTTEEVQQMVIAFGDASRRCMEAGFDFIEIHGAHGYLINQFLSPNSNQRLDLYGGSFQNRIRFLLEIVRDIKSKTGTDYPLGIRMNGQDYIENGWTLEEALHLAPILELEGVDYLHVSAGVYGSTQLTIPSMYVPQGCFLDLAQAVKKVVAIPVIGVGRIKNPELADQALRDRKADIIALGRSLLADPEWTNKAREGRMDAIRPCIGCCLGCIHNVLALEPGSCVVNPDVGREYLLVEKEAAPPALKVLVAGGGPAGLAAARMAAIRGHQVTLCEAGGHLGGLARLAAIPPGRAEIKEIIEYYTNELNRLQVEIRLNVKLDQQLMNAIEPQAVILASGSLPEIPMVKGLFRTRMTISTAIDVLAGKQVVDDPLIVLGGNQAGLVTADFLASQRKQVVVLHRGRHFAEELSSNDRYYLRERLKASGVRLFKRVQIEEIAANGITGRSEGQTFSLMDFGSLVIAEKMTPIRESVELLKNADVKLQIIGDARTPRTLLFAISEAEEAARAVG
jgi:2,4-dienoyl-CoA reductase-like NADH-dependent reductase (Old Yellow Enzyme family)/thioredoxin reductase